MGSRMKSALTTGTVFYGYTTKEIFTLIDKACHCQMANFKVRQQGNVGLVSNRSELIRRTLLPDEVTAA